MIRSIIVREPGGERELALPCVIGSDSESALRVPGFDHGNWIELFVDNDCLLVRQRGSQEVLLDGVPLQSEEPQVFSAASIITVGDVRLHLLCWSAEAQLLELRHLEGNETIAPLRAETASSIADADSDIRISVDERPDLVGTRSPAPVVSSREKHSWRFWGALAAVAVLLGTSVMLLASFERVEVVSQPQDAKVSARGLSWSAPGAVFVLPGERQVFVAKEGYKTVSRTLSVVRDQSIRLDVRLDMLPGIIDIDTGGVEGVAFVDGAEVGTVPGSVELPAGTRTLVVKAERYLDVVETLEVTGRGVRQPLLMSLQPSWGKLAVTTANVGAVLKINELTQLTLPATVDLPAGLHRLEVMADGAKPWRSAVLVKAGETQQIGPIELGAPDMVVQLRSRPSGAEVTVNGVYRGRTPAEVELVPGVEHEVLFSLQGYDSARRSVFAESGRRAELTVELPAVLVGLTVQGEPSGAEVFQGGRLLGTAPLTTRLTAQRHQLEVRKDGLQSQTLNVDLSSAIARSVEYRLVPVGRANDWAPPQAAVKSASGVLLRLMPTAAAILGSERREQGRRANEFQRQVEFTRPFYFGTREVTNGEFRRFRPKHVSGFVGRRTLDLDGHPVTSITWSDAVEYCNWLSEQDGLPPAYEKQAGKWTLRQPVTTGYRLPTEAEWEFVARYAGTATALRRYEWGDALPPPQGFANLAGTEVANEMAQVLEGWQDEYPAVAPPGKFPANALGIFDMTGNVSEWVHDTYVSFDPAAGGKDPLGPAAGNRRVIKGSSWKTSSFSELRPAWREAADAGSQTIGFRVARYAE